MVIVCHLSLFVICYCFSFVIVVICYCFSFVIVCHLSLFVVCHCLLLVVVFCLSLFVVVVMRIHINAICEPYFQNYNTKASFDTLQPSIYYVSVRD